MAIDLIVCFNCGAVVLAKAFKGKVARSQGLCTECGAPNTTEHKLLVEKDD
jgi:ribosomal protein S27AE